MLTNIGEMPTQEAIAILQERLRAEEALTGARALLPLVYLQRTDRSDPFSIHYSQAGYVACLYVDTNGHASRLGTVNQQLLDAERRLFYNDRVSMGFDVGWFCSQAHIANGVTITVLVCPVGKVPSGPLVGSHPVQGDELVVQVAPVGEPE